MKPIRQLLKTSIADGHERLENLPIMRAYSNGDASFEEYIKVTDALAQFWTLHVPATRKLPEDFYRFFSSYLEALQRDINRAVVPSSLKPTNEIAFFYVLLGSGLGAKIILKRNVKQTFPNENLLVLAQNSGQLWQKFNDEHLQSVSDDQSSEVIEASKQLFNHLFKQIYRIQLDFT